MSEVKVSIATMGTRETVQQVSATVPVVTGANTMQTAAVTFEKAFVQAPVLLAVSAKTIGLRKAILSVDTITTTGMNVNVFQINSDDVATGDHVVDVTLVGWKVS
jgi:hypothetical protein